MGYQASYCYILAEEFILGDRPTQILNIEETYNVLHKSLLGQITSAACRSVLTAGYRLYEKGKPVSRVTLQDMDKNLTPKLLDEILAESQKVKAKSGAGQVSYRTILLEYQNFVHKAALKTFLSDSGINISNSEKSALELIYEAKTKLENLETMKIEEGQSGHIGKFAKAALDEIVAARTNSFVRGDDSGIVALDEIMGGFKRKKNIVIAGRPSSGKSALALTIALNMARQGKAVGFISIEMDAVETAIRALCILSQVSEDKMQDEAVVGTEYERKLMDAYGELQTLPLFFYDVTADITATGIEAKVREWVNEHQIHGVFIDYLQQVSAPEIRSNEPKAVVAYTSTKINNMKKKYNIWVAPLSQMNRARSTEKPILSDLKETSQLEQDADVVLFVHREVEEDGTFSEAARHVRTLVIAKNRGGSIGEVKVGFTGNTYTFIDKNY